MRRSLSRDDQAIAAVIGAIVVLAVLGIALVYVNAYHVPRQGAALETVAAERSEAALVDLAGRLAARADGPVVREVPLRAERPSPPLLSGLVLSPARAQGELALAPAPSRIGISVVVPAPAGGVPAGDPTREALAGGKMRVHLLGTSAGAQPLGALHAVTGGAYLTPTRTILEGGAVIADTERGSALVGPPALTVAGNVVTWRLPLLTGAASEVAGGSHAQVALTPGPEAQVGGGSRVEELRIRVETQQLAAWQAALEEVVGSRGTVTVTSTGPDAGVVQARILDVEPKLHLVRYQAMLADRVG